MNQNWNADNYSSNFSFVYNYGQDVINLIEFENVKSIIDLGCGTGTLTKILHDKGFDVTGIDASQEMLAKAKNNYPEINFIHSDAVNFSVESKVDVIFSNAVLHWIDKKNQSNMMNCVYNALNDNGQFVFEMGGYGCCEIIHEALRESFTKRNHEYIMPFYFPKIGEYANMLEQTGFTVKFAVLFARPTKLNGINGVYDWIKMFVSAPFKNINHDEKEEIMREAAESDLVRSKLFHDGNYYADYVRLRMRAVK